MPSDCGTLIWGGALCLKRRCGSQGAGRIESSASSVAGRPLACGRLPARSRPACRQRRTGVRQAPYSRRLSRIAGLGPLSHDGGTDTAFELAGAFVPPRLAPSEAPEPNGHRRGHVLRDETGGGFREQGTVARAPNVWRAIC